MCMALQSYPFGKLMEDAQSTLSPFSTSDSKVQVGFFWLPVYVDLNYLFVN